MRFRDHVALTLPALILRLVLALTFLWAGIGKIIGEFEVTGDPAARLAKMGMILTETVPAPEPIRDLPLPTETQTNPAPASPPSTVVVPEGEPTLEDIQEAVAAAADALADQAEDTIDQVTDTQPGPDDAPDDASDNAPNQQWAADQTTGTTYSPDDFRGTYTVQRVAGVALLLSRAGNPGLDADSNRLPATMPAWVAAERWPFYFAWAAAITELLAAVLLFFGVLTRFGALMIVGVMVTAMWLTQIGPAAMGLTDSYLGFIPKADDPWAPSSYATLLWQIACLAMAAAVFMLGSGPVGFDRALFRPPERLERNEPAKRERTVFDRGPNETP